MRFFSFFGNSTISKITLGSASRALWAAEPRGLNDNSSQFYLSIIVNFFPFCGLEECAMHIDNPQMRGLFFCGGAAIQLTIDRHYSVKGSITKRASESVKKRTYNLPSLTYARKADISNTNTCGSTLVESTASIFWYNTTSS